MSTLSADVVICGAGIAGASCAYQLAVHAGVANVVLVDEGPPLSLTSDKSTECYRNWWPGPGDAVVRLMNRSIDLLEELTERSGNRFLMNRRGYLYASADADRVEDLRAAAREAEALGAGRLREHARADADYRPHCPEGLEPDLDGSDLITAPALIAARFPYLSRDTVAVLHARRCGWLSAQQLGAYWLEEARAHGARLLQGRVEAVEQRGGRVSGVVVEGRGERIRIASPAFVNCAGPFAGAVSRLLDIDLPIYCERHVKVSIDDTLGAVGRDAPLIIWADPVALPWTAPERESLAEDPQTRYLLETLPAGVHGRPTGGAQARSLLLYWTYDETPVEPVFPLEWDPAYPEIVLRGMAAMIPALSGYFGHLPRPFVDGGYYARTTENRPLIGPLPVEGAYVCAAFSGFGIMASAAAGELLREHLMSGGAAGGAGGSGYAPAFSLERYADPDYRALLAQWPGTGQL